MRRIAGARWTWAVLGGIGLTIALASAQAAPRRQTGFSSGDRKLRFELVTEPWEDAERIRIVTRAREKLERELQEHIARLDRLSTRLTADEPEAWTTAEKYGRATLPSDRMADELDRLNKLSRSVSRAQGTLYDGGGRPLWTVYLPDTVEVERTLVSSTAQCVVLFEKGQSAVEAYGWGGRLLWRLEQPGAGRGSLDERTGRLLLGERQIDLATGRIVR